MKTQFDADPFPERPKILFIALAQGSHTRSWIDLLEDAEFNVRLFGLRVPGGFPAEDWPVKTYVTAYHREALDPATRRSFCASRRAVRLFNLLGRFLRWFGLDARLVRAFEQQRWPFRSGRRQDPCIFLALDPQAPEEFWLAQVIRHWQPEIIHTMGLDPAGQFYLRVRNRFGLEKIGKWILQLRGGSDLTLTRFDPEQRPAIAAALRACDQLVSDNEVNYGYASELGMNGGRVADLGTVPGTGGVDVACLSSSWQGPPSSRRIILWPKAYDSPWSKALPVFEALKMVWDQIEPCEIYMLVMTVPGTRMWYRALPEKIKRHCHVEERIPRQKLMELMEQARVMLAPSLVDGIPNSMLEAMAAGAFPIVSPLDTISRVVKHEDNVLFARNLYPHEVAEALVRAMTDDDLVDRAAERNLALVRKIADRSKIGPRVIKYYEALARNG
jgi:glycosyltransferase involved in cell wall biosynthesis